MTIQVLMVAEKPSVAKILAEHLSGGRLRREEGGGDSTGQTRSLKLSSTLVRASRNAREVCCQSVDARQEMDMKIGVAFSRLMTRAYLDMAKEKFRLRDQKVISFGP
jgi:DNA topoisomerase IA